MLSIAKLSTGQERYYLDHAEERVDFAEAVAGGAEDYYLDPSEARGSWLGAGARRLGLRGDVDGPALRRVLGAMQPETGAPLRERASRISVAGYDLTFSAPKSVSVVFGLGGPAVRSAVRAAHDRAVAEAMGYMERSAAAVRRGKGGATVAPAEGFISAAFRHRTSRAAEPQLHTHVVIANVGMGPDGRWTALDGRRIFDHARTASFMYQAVLRGELTRVLGVQWHEVVAGIGEVQGVPQEVMDSFSTRRAEIEAALASRGTHGPRAAEAAALATRRGKVRDQDGHELLESWRATAEEAGWTSGCWSEILDHARDLELDPVEWEQAVAQMLGPDGLTKRRSSFTRREVVQAVAMHLPAGLQVTGVELERLADQVLALPGVVPLVGESHAATTDGAFRRRDGRIVPLAKQEHRFTTAELLGVEHQLLDDADRSASAGAGVASPETVERAVSVRPSLSGEQRVMIEHLCRAGNSIAVVAGVAGTGKTFALAAAHEAWTASGWTVMGCAVARRAARELQEGAGIPSTSVHALLRRLEAGGRFPPRCVLVVDEAGMLATRDTAALSRHVLAAGGKLVLVGDHRQLPELEAGGAFRALARRPIAVRLTENRRQADAWEREALTHLRVGRAEAAIDLYASHGRLQTFASADEAKGELVAAWWSGGTAEAVMIAQRRVDVADLNSRARELMRRDGRLGEGEVVVGGHRFAVGDRIVIKRNDPARGVLNGDIANVVDADPRLLRILVQRTGSDTPIELDAGFLLRRTADGSPSITHAYAITAHVAQGMTVDHAYVLGGPGISREWAYTAMSRGRLSNHLFSAPAGDVGREAFGPRDIHAERRDAREVLIERLEQSEAQPLALDHALPRAPQRGRGLSLGD